MFWEGLVCNIVYFSLVKQDTLGLRKVTFSVWGGGGVESTYTYVIHKYVDYLLSQNGNDDEVT